MLNNSFVIIKLFINRGFIYKLLITFIKSKLLYFRPKFEKYQQTQNLILCIYFRVESI